MVLSIALDDRVPAKVNGFARTGDSVVLHTDVFDVSPTNPVFSPILDSLRVEPLPVRKNPASHEREFGGSDIPVRNLTVPQQPVSYRFVQKPVARDEYTFRTADAYILFGQPQKVNDKLEVTHWTVASREDITIDRFQGKLTIELCTATSEQAETLYGAIENKLTRERNLLREGGFYKFAPYTLEPATAVVQTTPFSSSFPLWRLRLGYRFAFEKERGGESSTGSTIRRIDVDLTGEQAEKFSLPDNKNE
jgi:hypothetical protein